MQPIKAEYSKAEQSAEPLLRYLVDPPFRIYRRIAFVLVLVILMKGGNEQRLYAESTFLWLKLGAILVIISLTALNLYVLIPRFLFRGKYTRYFLWVTGGILLSYLVLMRVRSWLPSLYLSAQPTKQVDPIGDLLAYVVLLCVLCAATAGIKLFQCWIKDHYRLTQLENVRMHTELDQLKSNISPHFLFNMLSGSEVLIRTEPEKSSQILIRLSDLLRYQLYDSSREQVLLSADIRFLHHFLSLEKIRRDHFEFNIKESGTDTQLLIPPLLFIPFVENAVKHNIYAETGAYVDIEIKVTPHGLTFRCTNPKPQHPTAETGGLGLRNVKRRLELLYPGKHQLIIRDEPTMYTVTLTLQL